MTLIFGPGTLQFEVLAVTHSTPGNFSRNYTVLTNQISNATRSTYPFDFLSWIIKKNVEIQGMRYISKLLGPHLIGSSSKSYKQGRARRSGHEILVESFNISI